MSKFTLLQRDAAQSREQLREQIRQTVRDAQVAAEQAARDAAQERGVLVVPPLPPHSTSTGMQFPQDIPPRAENVAVSFFIMIGVIVIAGPFVRAIARRIDRAAPVAGPIPVEVKNQLLQISQSVDAIAIEVERISEGQRFTTKMLSDRVKDGTTITPGASR
ncbi:MAG: hypothetical protein ABI556_08095 [Gemmatimonadales bacterium]